MGRAKEDKSLSALCSTTKTQCRKETCLRIETNSKRSSFSNRALVYLAPGNGRSEESLQMRALTSYEVCGCCSGKQVILFDAPNVIHTDQGSNIHIELMKKSC